MNTLTANLHLMLVSFYRPAGARARSCWSARRFPPIATPSNRQVRFHGLDPARDLIEIAPRDGEDLLRTEDIVATVEREGARIRHDPAAGSAVPDRPAARRRGDHGCGRKAGCVVGWDLAHAVGQVPVALHDAGADFACGATTST